MEIRQLATFIAVSEELHFGHAAARLGISQPTLSRQLQSLEKQLGVRLVTRGPHITLTDAGEMFAVKARAVLDALEMAVLSARDANEGPQ